MVNAVLEIIGQKPSGDLHGVIRSNQATLTKPKEIMEHIDRLNMFGEKCPPCHTCYASKCRCEECKEEELAYKHRLHKRKNPGWDNPLIPAHDVRAHIRELGQQGMGLYIVAKEAGLPISTLQKIMSGKTVHKVRKQTALKIMAVVMNKDWSVAVPMAQRKLFECGLEGVPLTVVAKELGVPVKTLSEIRWGIPARIKRSTFDGIIAFDPKKFPRDKRVVTVTRNLKKRFDDEQRNAPKVRINSKRHKVSV